MIETGHMDTALLEETIAAVEAQIGQATERLHRVVTDRDKLRQRAAALHRELKRRTE